MPLYSRRVRGSGTISHDTELCTSNKGILREEFFLYAFRKLPNKVTGTCVLNPSRQGAKPVESYSRRR